MLYRTNTNRAERGTKSDQAPLADIYLNVSVAGECSDVWNVICALIPFQRASCPTQMSAFTYPQITWKHCSYAARVETCAISFSTLTDCFNLTFAGPLFSTFTYFPISLPLVTVVSPTFLFIPSTLPSWRFTSPIPPLCQLYAPLSLSLSISVNLLTEML